MLEWERQVGRDKERLGAEYRNPYGLGPHSAIPRHTWKMPGSA